MDRLKEACGVFGCYDLDGNDVVSDIYYGLNALQHRGQESCGIAVSDTAGEQGNVRYRKDLGMVQEVFREGFQETLKGNIGIGHVRYSTTGETTAKNAQPLVLSYAKGSLSLAHNGNLVNISQWRKKLEEEGMIFHTTTDSEVIACSIARERVRSDSVEEAVRRTLQEIRGAYALVIMSPRKLMAIRDPLGLKPLCLGRKGNRWVAASESCALEAVGAEFVRDVKPGEMVSITSQGIHAEYFRQKQEGARCAFEYIYFARLDSVLDQVPVYEARLTAGQLLYESAPVEADLVAGVPDSGVPAAKGYAEASGIPFGMALYKNSYVGRTFIKPTQQEREDGVRMKLSVLASAVRGRRVVLVDDSLVRGTTMASLIYRMKKAGAREVHVRISSPPFLHPCYFGTDIPTNRQLMAATRTKEEICREIGADSLEYLRIEDLEKMARGLKLCTGCFQGVYPIL